MAKEPVNDLLWYKRLRGFIFGGDMPVYNPKLGFGITYALPLSKIRMW